MGWSRPRLSELSLLARSFMATRVSVSTRWPAMALNSFSLGANLWYAFPISVRACSQVAGINLSLRRISGVVNLCVFSPSQANLVLSLIHSSLTSSFSLGMILITSNPFASILIFEPRPSSTSTDSKCCSSHGRARKA